jgi:hypothetical protein
MILLIFNISRIKEEKDGIWPTSKPKIRKIRELFVNSWVEKY